MGVTSFVRKPDGRSWSMDRGSGVWKCTEVWQATFDDEIADPLVFLGDPLLPAIGTEHPENSLLRLEEVPGASPPSDRSLKALNFTLVWSTARFEATQFHKDKYDANAAEKSWSHNAIQVPVEEAYVSDDEGETWSDEKKPIANTLDDLFIPGITTNRYLPICHYTRNELVVPAEILSLPGTINNDEFTLDGLTIGIGQALIASCPVSAEKRFENDVFRTVNYEIMLKEEGWDERLLNKGFWFYPLNVPVVDPEAPAVWAIKERVTLPNGQVDDEEGERIWVAAEEPVTLNLEGQHLEFWVNKAGLSEETFIPHFRRFRHLKTTSFDALGFT